MPLLIHLKQLEERNELLAGEISVTELALGFEDEIVRFSKPLTYRLEAQHLEDSVLVSGELEMPIECACVRCLKPMPETIRLRNWHSHIPLAGEDSATIVRDAVDLTPYIREDMVLALPTHPVCRDDCPGLTGKTTSTRRTAAKAPEGVASPWDELNKLKLKS